jgi:hypothetical protein
MIAATTRESPTPRNEETDAMGRVVTVGEIFNHLAISRPYPGVRGMRHAGVHRGRLGARA